MVQLALLSLLGSDYDDNNDDNDDDDNNDDCIADGDDDMRRERVREFLPEFFVRSLLCKYPTILNQTQHYSTISNNSQHDFFDRSLLCKYPTAQQPPGYDTTLLSIIVIVIDIVIMNCHHCHWVFFEHRDFFILQTAPIFVWQYLPTLNGSCCEITKPPLMYICFWI